MDGAASVKPKSGAWLAGPMDRVVVALGGSIVAPADPDPDYLEQLLRRIEAWAGKARLLLVVGGGHPARRHIELARRLHVGEEDLDRIGIAATRLNAQFLQSALHARGVPVVRDVHHSTTATIAAMEKEDRTAVMGGTAPGHSTDQVAAELAIGIGADRLVIVTNVDGVYTTDPRTDPDAEHRARLDFEELLQIIEEEEWTTAGAPGVIDGPATVLIATHGITTRVVNGADLDNLEHAIMGGDFHGTHVEGAKVVLG